MLNAANYFKAARPEPPRIIGLQLRPYSLGHHINLAAYGISFTTRGEPAYADLILGVLICSLTWREWEDWRRSWKLPIFLKIWGWFFRRFDVREEGERFAQYLINGSERPEVAVPAKSTPLVSAWESRLKMFLIEHLRLTEEEALDHPLALAWQDYCAHGEANGRLTLLSEADEALFEFQRSDRVKTLVAEAEAAAKREVEEMKAKAATQKEGAN